MPRSRIVANAYKMTNPLRLHASEARIRAEDE